MKKTFRHSPILLMEIAIFLVFIGFNSGCKKSSDTTTMSGPGTNEVWMQNTAFNPSSITVAVNTTITWTNKDGMAHTVTSNTGLFDSGTINGGGTYSHQFTTAGTFSYKCSFHSGMTGVVIVQ
ncbi:MAG: plastocyanin/azurin family copper-binding protein [Bacteroidia bacterium]